MNTKGLIEGILFAAPSPLSVGVIAELLQITKEEVESLILELQSEYESESHGMRLVSVSHGFQFRTKEDLKEIMSRFYEKKAPRLSGPMLEVLSIIAYKQPVTRPEIEKYRGVDCSSVLKTLLERELIEMQGRSPLPGNPVIYGTTSRFLEWFQISRIEDLPPLSEIEILNRATFEGGDALMDLLQKDDGFSAETLEDMDATIKQASRAGVDVPWEKSEDEQAVQEPSQGQAGAQATEAP